MGTACASNCTGASLVEGKRRAMAGLVFEGMST